MIRDQKVIVIFKLKKEILSYKGEDVLTYQVKYPVFYSEIFSRAVEKINLYYENKVKEFLVYCEGTLFKQAVSQYKTMKAENFPFNPYEAMLVSTVTYNANCTVSLYFDRYEYTGGAHGSTKREANTWDLNSGRKYSLPWFFPCTKDFKQYIFKEIDPQISANPSIYFPEYKSLMAETFNADSFYLISQGVVIYYGQYDIAPYSSGIREFLFPFEKGKVKSPSC